MRSKPQRVINRSLFPRAFFFFNSENSWRDNWSRTVLRYLESYFLAIYLSIDKYLLAFHFDMIYTYLTRWFTRLVEIIYVKIHASGTINNSANICYLSLFIVGILYRCISAYYLLQCIMLGSWQLFISHRSVLQLLPSLFWIHIFHLASVKFMCIFHGLSDSLYTYSMTSYYISGALCSHLQKRPLDYNFAVVLWSMIMSFFILFLTSLFFSRCCIGCGYLPRLVSAF